MKIVSIESPFAGAERRNILYAQAAMYDSLCRGEAPLASHLLYPQVLRDSVPAMRRVGLDASHAWRRRCDLIAVYTDLGVSNGMQEGADQGDRFNIPIEVRKIDPRQLEVVLRTASLSKEFWPILLDFVQ